MIDTRLLRDLEEAVSHQLTTARLQANHDKDRAYWHIDKAMEHVAEIRRMVFLDGYRSGEGKV